ncbi:hypothetical protein IMSAGC019_03498 [Lachnospiraceae bacterium]|nr:hypothetical protein IMSAGC019_03498 [Lachnospiraceae bacterium]
MAVFFLFCINGCGSNEEDMVLEPQWENVDVGAGSGTAGPKGDSGGREGEEPAGVGDGAGKDAKGAVPYVEGMIKEQSFETKLDGWGEVFFASIAPADGTGEPAFLLLKDENTVYTFPKAEKEEGKEFTGVGAVAFRDYNQDGKQDVIVLVTYTDGGREWNEPKIFLQENPDNMFYLDHPGLESYRIEGKAQEGPSFYRDTLLEEYLTAQGLAGSIASLAKCWEDYVAYADGLMGVLGIGQQIELFARNRMIWADEIAYADDRYCFTLAGLTNDGRPTLIVANQGGTGMYTYSEFYKIDQNGELQKLGTSFREGDSQPDIIEDRMTVYSSWSKEGIRNHFIVYDQIKDSPDTYLYRTSSLDIWDDYVTETPLASQKVVYEGENNQARVTSEDCGGNALTEEEYDNFPDVYYGNMGLTKKTAVFKWMDVKSLEGMDGQEAAEALRQSYEGFSMEE